MIKAGPLELRPIERDAARAVLDGRAPDGLVLAESFPSPFSLEIAEYAIQQSDDPRFGHYFIVRRGDDAIVGEIGTARDDDGGAQIGYGVVERARGHGYASAAVQALTAHLLATPDTGRVFATVPVDNVPSRRVLEKAGFAHGDPYEEDVDGERMAVVDYETAGGGASTSP